MTWDNSVPRVRLAGSRAGVERALMTRLGAGTLKVDQKLPTCAQLAEELGVNKNTVSKAYQSLARRGYLRTAPGKGTFVVRRPPRAGARPPLKELEELFLLAVQEAKLAGIDRDRFLKLVEASVDRYYSQKRVRIGFVECNLREAARLSRDLQSAVSHPVEPLLLDAVVSNPLRYLAGFDLLGVPLSHLSELDRALDKSAGPSQPEVVGLYVSPDPESFGQVVRLRPGTRVIVVCDLEDTLQVLLGLLRSHNSGLQLEGCLVSDLESVNFLLARADLVVVTLSAESALAEQQPAAPVVTVSFQLDQRSVQQLATRLDALQRGELLPTAS